MKRRILTGLLACCLSLSLALPGSAAGAVPSEQEAAQAVTALGIMAGDAGGDLALSRTVTRAEFVTMALKASPGGERVGTASTSPYPDVPYTHWAAGYVEAGVAAGLISGYSDGTFRPGSSITLAEGASIALRLLGYTEEDFSGAYPTPQMALYHSLGLDRGVNVQSAQDVLTRRDAMYLFYNLMTAPARDGTPYLNQLGYALNAAGELDLVALVNGSMEGPLVAAGDWRGALPFSLTGVTVNRDGRLSSVEAIQENDVIYWNEDMRALWVSSKKAAGVIQALEPSSANPETVQLLGRTYAIETAQAAYALSDLGYYREGDAVTLLLSRSGGVAAVAAPSEAAEETGVVIETGRTSYPDGHGDAYLADTVTVLGMDGETYQYQWSGGGLEAGDPVGVSFSSDGSVTLKRLHSAGLSGQVSQDGSRIGKLSFAAGAELLDVTGSSAMKIFPSRLAGVTLDREDVVYYALDAGGDICSMILNDATGDAGRYGVLTRMESLGEGMSALYSYTYVSGGTTYTLPASTTRYPVSAGPIRIVGDPSSPDRLLPLTEVEGSVSGNALLADGKRYPIAGQAQVYEYRDRRYIPSTLALVQEKGLSLTGWYDRPVSEGGRIRVIIAR